MKKLLAIMALIPCVCMAAEPQGKWWVSATVASKHINTNDKFNERNPGIGIEYHHSEDIVLVAGEYRNSVWRDSFYAMAAYTPLHIGFASIGVAGGIITGYPAYHNGNPAPAAFGLVRLEGERFGGNLIVIPPIQAKDYTPLTIGLQLKYRF
jgi:hypothetical protein